MLEILLNSMCDYIFYILYADVIIVELHNNLHVNICYI